MPVHACQPSGQICDCRQLFTNIRGNFNRDKVLRWSRQHYGNLHRERTYGWINNWSQNYHKRYAGGNLHCQLRRHRRYHPHYHAGDRPNEYLRGRLRHHSGNSYSERRDDRHHNCRRRGKPDHWGGRPGWPLSNPSSNPATGPITSVPGIMLPREALRANIAETLLVSLSPPRTADRQRRTCADDRRPSLRAYNHGIQIRPDQRRTATGNPWAQERALVLCPLPPAAADRHLIFFTLSRKTAQKRGRHSRKGWH